MELRKAKSDLLVKRVIRFLLNRGWTEIDGNETFYILKYLEEDNVEILLPRYTRTKDFYLTMKLVVNRLQKIYGETATLMKYKEENENLKYRFSTSWILHEVESKITPIMKYDIYIPQ